MKGLEYLGTKLKSGAEAKRFVTLDKSEELPTKEQVITLASANPKVRKAWVMKMEGNNWSKVQAIGTIDI